MTEETHTQMKHFFDTLAPRWYHMEVIPQERKRELLTKLDIHKGDKILDVACGTGVITGMLSQLSRETVIGIDLSSEMIKIAKEKYEGQKDVSFIEGDFLSYPFEEESFDFVIIYNAYPHFLYVESLKKTIYRVLKKDGRFAILHSLSRKELSVCHQNTGNLSRLLLTTEEESRKFTDLFTIEKAEEGEHHFLILGRKK